MIIEFVRTTSLRLYMSNYDSMFSFCGTRGCDSNSVCIDQQNAKLGYVYKSKLTYQHNQIKYLRCAMRAHRGFGIQFDKNINFKNSYQV